MSRNIEGHRGGRGPKITKEQRMLLEARDGLLPLRNEFVLSNFWLLLIPLTPEQKLLILNVFFNQPFKEETAITRKKIGPPKVKRDASLTSYPVEENVKKNAGDFSLAIFSSVFGRTGSRKQEKLYREFGEYTVKPHIVWTKVIQRQESGVKGHYGRDDNRGHISLFTRLFKERVEREKKEAGKS